MIWERKLPPMILIGHTVEESESLIIVLHDPLLLNLQGATFAIEFLKLTRNLKEKL